MACATGVPPNYLFIRGQQTKFASMLHRKAKNNGLLAPEERSGKTYSKFEREFFPDPV